MLKQLLTSFVYPIIAFYYRLNPGIRILMYHRVFPLEKFDQLTVNPTVFDQQMQYLSRHFHVISLGDAIERLKKRELKKNYLVITFDDGYLDNLTYALPILEKYQLPATIFVTTDFAQQSINHPRYRESTERLHLNWKELKALSLNSLITIGGHTRSHPFLMQLPQEKLVDEIGISKGIIESQLGKPVSHFCYPSGNYSKREIACVENNNYQTAVTVSPGVNRDLNKPFELKRTEITQKDQGREFVKKISGAYDCLHLLLDWKRRYQFNQRFSREERG